ncbi:MAG: sigma-70 family RNA polymerase sigma factor, partial [Planctomycetes bacterium]|nr:sigma-70 family RNA polymerase sigma factor [Planctomycetota bacterium]
REELRQRLWAHLLELPTRQREVLVLRRMAGLEIAEVAELLGLSESTVRVHGHAGREALRKRMSGMEGWAP